MKTSITDWIIVDLLSTFTTAWLSINAHYRTICSRRQQHADWRCRRPSIVFQVFRSSRRSSGLPLSCTRLRIWPLRVLQATRRTELVKGPGGISAPTIRRPWNLMPHTLMHVARWSLNQRELVLVAVGHGRRSPCQLVATRLAQYLQILNQTVEMSFISS